MPFAETMKCTIYAYGTLLHLSQIYTGFSLLAMKGDISLTQQLNRYTFKGKELLGHLQPHATYGLFCVLDDERVLFYDVRDGSDLSDEVLEIVDAYFKRSYVAAVVPDRHKSKVFPLGLNYEVYAGMRDRYEFQRFILRGHVLDRFPVEMMRCIAQLCSLSFLPTVSKMHSLPMPDQEPRVLFIARAWDPDNDPPGLSVKEKSERGRINEMRAQCIELLRKELGCFFYGGFVQSDYACRNFKELLLENASVSGKKNYIALLKEYPICIATTGLHGSIGWKMGEYVAFAKAIVSERLNCEVPCGFEKELNYLEFDTAEVCLKQTMKLVQNRQIRHKIMFNNRLYFEKCLRPDKLVLRTLNIAKNL